MIFLIHIQDLPRNQKTIAAFDMDDTLVTKSINEENNFVDKLREGEDTTNAIKELQNMNIEKYDS